MIKSHPETMVDLHTHTTASDGTLTPEGLAELAAEKGLAAVAVTDHDTVAGVAAAQARGDELGVHVVPGLELGARWDGGGSLHLLGYYVDTSNPRLRERLREFTDGRRARAAHR
ncbi:MAG: PHP domain-containing protein [Terriglobia bacterium]